MNEKSGTYAVIGYVPTPDHIVDEMVGRLFQGMPPKASDFLLDPGCGDGQFISGVLRWCRSRKIVPPHIVGVEINPELTQKARSRFASNKHVKIIEGDFLASEYGRRFRYEVSNPPYVSLENIDPFQRDEYRSQFLSACGRFDLYMLFFEQATRHLEDGGRLVFVTPEKFTYVEAARPLRKILAGFQIESIDLIDEDAFCDRTTYPSITTIRSAGISGETIVRLRDGTVRDVRLPSDGTTWQPFLMGYKSDPRHDMVPLSSYCRRISAGVATGADGVFTLAEEALDTSLRQFAHPALGGRDISLSDGALPTPRRHLLAPYDNNGRLIPETRLGALGKYLRIEENLKILEHRSCVRSKPWYAFHDNFPISDIKSPKILFKDIGERPKFWIDRTGSIIPLHSLYYLIPENGSDIDALCSWMNGPEAVYWLKNNCQRAANGFIRLQSRVIKNMPVPDGLSNEPIKKVA